MKKRTLTNEEISSFKNKFKLLCEYDFYTGDKDLILGSEMTEADEPVEDKPEDSEGGEDNMDAELDSVASELGVDDSEGGEENMEEPAKEPTPEPVAPPAPPQDDSIELDVTELVNSNNEVKQIVDESNQKASDLLNKFTELLQKVDKVDKLGKKIQDLEKEVIKRTPTPVEKMEMRSLNSFPYSLKLTDFWSEKEGQYDVMNVDKKKEYVLTKDDINRTYSDSEIKRSFDVGYEEEDI
jgi:hypothetical protein